MKKDVMLEKISRNSKAVYTIFGILFVFFVFVYKVGAYINDTKDLPKKMKQVEKDIDALKPLIAVVQKIEERQNKFELQITAGFNRLETKLDQVQMIQNIINTQIVKSGMEHKK